MQTAHPDGDANTPDDSAAEDAEKGVAATWRGLFFFTTKAHMPVLIVALLASLVSGTISPARSFLTGRVGDRLTAYASGALPRDEFMSQVRTYVYYFLIIGAISWITLYIELTCWIAFGELQAKSARDRLFHGLLKKDIEWYDLRKHGISALLPRLQAQIRALQLATAQPMGILVGTASTSVFSLIQALVLSWKLTLVTLSTAPVVTLAVFWVGKGMQHAFQKQDNLLTEALKHATNALSAIETVKSFNAEECEHQKYTVGIAGAATWYYRAVNRNALQLALITLLFVSVFVQGFYYGGILIANGETSVADVFTAFISAVGAFQAINAILPQLMVLEKGRNAGSIVRSIMADIQRETTTDRAQGTLRPAKCYGAIEVRRVTFSYPSRPHHPALSDVSMFIPHGEISFLIGRSGSGKSTLGQLLMRFYMSSHGTIHLDGVDLDLLDIGWLRHNITLVEQTTSLFNDTLFRNIALGQHNLDKVSPAEFANATQFALLQALIADLPDGAQTLVGYKGSALSGGQRQRLALARARLRDTPVLILDESTSALDHISRALMLEAIRNWRRGKTTIIVTHDISQILPEDYLFVLENGSIVQEGYRKHLEPLKDTPFQSFLPKDMRASTSAFHARKTSSVYSVPTRGTSLCAQTAHWSGITADPIEAQLNSLGSRRGTMFPLIFQDGSPVPVFQARNQSTISPWTRLVTSSPSESPPTSFWSGLQTPQSKIKTADQSKPRISISLADHIQRTAIRAVDSRKPSRREYRRLLRTEEGQSRKDSIAKGSKHRNSAAISLEDPGKTSGNTLSLRKILSTLWPNIDWPTRLVLALGFWAATIHAISTPVFSYVFSKLLRLYSIPGGDRHQGLVYSMIILAISVIDSIHTYAYHLSLEYVGQRWVDSIRSEAMKSILGQPRAFFDDEENAVSRLTGSLDRNAEEMRNILGRFSALVWIAVVMCVVSVFWAMVTQWKMTLIALVSAPYILGVAKAFSMISERWEKRSNDTTEDAAAIFTETFINIKTVRALTLEQHFIDKYIKATNQALSIGFRRAFFTGFFYGLSDSSGNFSTAMIFYVGGDLVYHGVPVNDIIEVFVLLLFAIAGLRAILGFVPQITTSKDMASRLLRLVQLPEISHEQLGNARILGVGDIIFDDLHFSYPSRPEQSVLAHFNMHIRPGTCTAIVGGSGSGKSTIANLLLKLYSTTNTLENGSDKVNDLTFAGRNIKRIDTTTIRNLIVPVSQTPTLFPATVSENIAYGLSSTSPYNSFTCISAAAMQAGVHDFIISLPQGYDTPIGEGGLGVSGGQAQRIAIARALVRQPAVLILDEATSALDVESANLVRQTIETLVAGRDKGKAMTIVIITHNVEMMEIAENIVVLDNGRIVEEGGFQELMERKRGALVNLLNKGEWTGDRGV